MSKATQYQPEIDQFVTRKQDHIRLALQAENQAQGLSGLDRINFYHEALPDLDFSECNISMTSLNSHCTSPCFVSSMTAGHTDGIIINQRLATACQEMGWAMGVGSQRRQLMDKSAQIEWLAIREVAPNTELFSNIGLAQVITASIDDIQELIDTIQAKALIIHCNPLQECLQSEGTPQFKGCFDAIARLCDTIEQPIIIKETGCGFSPTTLTRLKSLKLAAVDVSGNGGTHWGRIEGQRVEQHHQLAKASKTFENWGMSTVDSLLAAVQCSPNYEIWGSGGVRSGLDCAKLIALGATRVGFAKPMLEAALDSEQAVIDLMQLIQYELKIAMFCTGSRNISELQENKLCR